jgi:hypothetical protein
LATAPKWKGGTNVQFIELAALVGRWLGRFAGLLAILIVAQIQYAYSVTPASDAGKVNNCVTDATLSNLKAGLERFAKTVTGRTEIPDEFLRQYFAECTLEGAQALLVKSGFDAGELDPRSNNSETKKGTRRLVLAEKNIRPFSLRAASLNSRFILRIDQSGALNIQGFFYFDAP